VQHPRLEDDVGVVDERVRPSVDRGGLGETADPERLTALRAFEWLEAHLPSR
jgi:hypothetical protein